MITNRRRFLKTSTAGLAGLTLARGASQIGCTRRPRDRPNFLWLDAEDLCPDLGCYGAALVKTPHLDRLAEEGTRFANAFTTSPVCSPSRSAMITGMYQTSTGTHHHRSHRDDGYKLPEGVRVAMEYFREAGYFNCRGEAADPDRPGKLDYNFEMSFEEAFDGTDWTQRDGAQPFFAHVHFSEAHRTFHRDPDNPVDPEQVSLPPCYPDHLITRLDWALYLETIQNLDKRVGQVLQRLEKAGLAENTIVFFTGDHGRPMVRGKQWLYDGGIHVPLIIWGPGQVSGGRVIDDQVTAIDLVPTWLALAGIEPPDHLQGRDLLSPAGLGRDVVFAARDRCDETDDRIRCVRTSRFKYIRNFYPERPYTQFNAYKKLQYPVLTLMEVLLRRGELSPEQAAFMAPTRPVEELYDLQSDPHEVHNLAGDPGHQQLLQELRGRLDRWIYETGDAGQVPEDPKVAAYWDNYSRQQYLAAGIRGRGLDPEITDEAYLDWWLNYLRELKEG